MSWMSWRARWRVYEFVRNSLWLVPLSFMVVAAAAGVLLPVVDENTSVILGVDFGSDAGRSVLGAVAGGMITFTGFVFSILLLAVQFGSSQFSPRMLRRFLRAPTTKLALGTFMATFVYALIVLRVVGTGDDADFVPHNSISLAIIMLLVSMLMFLRLLSKTTQGLRVAAVLGDLGRDAHRVVVRSYPDTLAPGARTTHAVWEPSGRGRIVPYRGGPSVVQSVDVENLVRRARQADAVIELVPRIGEMVSAGDALYRVHETGPRLSDEWLRGTVASGDERTLRQDPAFAFRLLADVSAKALSPGVNDPTTSTQAIDQIELLLRQVGVRDLDVGRCKDADGVVRLVLATPTWEDYLSLAVDETRQYGEGSIQVLRRLRALLMNVRDRVPEPRRAAVDVQLALLDSAATRVFPDLSDQRAAGAADRLGLGATSDLDLVPRQRASADEQVAAQPSGQATQGRS
jgi:uncharacterized membrane protein